MPLHRLTSLTIGVPDPVETTGYYDQFGLTPDSDGWLRTTDGGRQLRLVLAPTRRLLELGIGADSADDLGRIVADLRGIGLTAAQEADAVSAREPVTGARVTVEVAPRLQQPTAEVAPQNVPGFVGRATRRASGVLRTAAVRPRRLGHVVIGTTDVTLTEQFFTRGLGFKMSDRIKGVGAFLRCSTDHHNVLVLQAPVNFLHHTSWQVDDVDEVGRGANAMLEGHPERHVWGLGRHHAGSNFFWYLKDPAGNFSEYFSDLDCIVEDQLWTPEVFEGARGLFSWGPPPPPSFLAPDDLAALMTGAHSS